MRRHLGVAGALALATITAPSTAAAAPNVVAEPSAYDFRPVAVGQSWRGTTLRFRNAGDVAAELGSVAITGAPPLTFGPSRDTCSTTTLAPGASCSLDVSFRPLTAGVFRATLSIPSNAPGSPHNVNLSGTGVTSTATVLAATPPFVEFGTVVSGRAVQARGITLRNLGEVSTPPLVVRFRNGIGIHSPGESFALDSGTCNGAVLPPGADCRMSVRVVGRDPHLHRATIEILDSRRAVATVAVSAEVVESLGRLTPARGLLAHRLESAARAWVKRPRRQLAARGFRLGRVMQPTAGRLGLAVHALRGPRRRPVLMAAGRTTLVAGTPRRLTGGSTKRGRRLLRSASELRLRATLTFSPRAGKPVVIKRGLRIAP